MEQTAFDLGKELAEKLGNAVNSCDRRELIKGFVEGLDQHRTLQQQIMGLFVSWCLELSKLEPGQYDGRNEASVKLAQRIVSGAPFGDTYQGRASDTFLPFI
jgi:hypothetical protein